MQDFILKMRAFGSLVRICFVVLMLSVSSAYAEDDPDRTLGGNMSLWVELASDYVFRGESETNDGEIPSAKIAITWSHDSGLYAGIYYANNLFPTYARAKGALGSEDTDNKINAIVGPYIGVAGSLFNTGMSYNSFIFSYHYPDDSTSNYVEMFNFLTLPSYNNFTLKLEASPTFNEWFGVPNVKSYYLALHPSISLPSGVTVSGTYGWQIFYGFGAEPNATGHDPDWAHWSVGASKSFIGWNWDLRYHDTDIKVGENAGYYDGANNNIVDGRVVLAVSRSF